jgi:hypothetical protein
MASVRFHHNAIAMLQDDLGNVITDHEAMAGLL